MIPKKPALGLDPTVETGFRIRSCSNKNARKWSEPLPAILAAAGLLAEPHLLGKLRAGLGVFRRHHRIIGRQTPFLAILLRRHAVARAQVPLERLEFVSVFQAHEG